MKRTRLRCSMPALLLAVFCSLTMARVSAADVTADTASDATLKATQVESEAASAEAKAQSETVPGAATGGAAATGKGVLNTNAPFRLKDDVQAQTSQQSGRSLATLLFGLFAVLAAIFGLAWLSKRFNLTLPGATSNMKLLGALSVGSKEKLLLVEVEGSKLLLGVTPQQINLLKNFDALDAPTQQGEFSDKMLKLLQAEAGDDR